MARETGRTEPKYRQIASDLRARIEAGEFPDGRLPGKESLKAHYRVAVNTLDRVLQVLRSEGRIETVQGAGTFIRDPGEPERSPEFFELDQRIAAETDGQDALRREIERLRREVEALQVDVMELYAKLGYEQPSHEQDGRKARHEDAG
jgi:DNA-binding GntR family transcriptional regulator